MHETTTHTHSQRSAVQCACVGAQCVCTYVDPVLNGQGIGTSEDDVNDIFRGVVPDIALRVAQRRVHNRRVERRQRFARRTRPIVNQIGTTIGSARVRHGLNRVALNIRLTRHARNTGDGQHDRHRNQRLHYKSAKRRGGKDGGFGQNTEKHSRFVSGFRVGECVSFIDG
jgi:hypothetical protein